MEEQQRDFKGVFIPKEIWLDKRLNALEKVIFIEIDSLDNEETGCYASNEYLAEFCQCSNSKVSSAISKLKQLGYIYEKSFDGRKRILKSRFTKNERQTTKICKADIENLKENNISNNINNNKRNNKEKSKFVPPTLEEVQAYAKEQDRLDLAQDFYTYYTATKWVDKNGKAIKSWKHKFITWTMRNAKPKTQQVKIDRSSQQVL